MMEVDLVATFVDDDLMVEPTQDDQFVLIGLPTPGPRCEMVDLEPVLGDAAVCTAGVVVPGK
jgi:hypothetical protein